MWGQALQGELGSSTRKQALATLGANYPVLEMTMGARSTRDWPLDWFQVMDGPSVCGMRRVGVQGQYLLPTPASVM